eukprot:GAHX01002449.1.p1 GENE.GAHX01002449.1~~GAHX01002449.1.p1  ORF type:complete len:76 (+),score=19.35 GAHX01002449.1:34-261(+)
MAKLKNHTNSNQSFKEHKNGIKRVLKPIKFKNIEVKTAFDLRCAATKFQQKREAYKKKMREKRLQQFIKARQAAN